MSLETLVIDARARTFDLVRDLSDEQFRVPLLRTKSAVPCERARVFASLARAASALSREARASSMKSFVLRSPNRADIRGSSRYAAPGSTT